MQHKLTNIDLKTMRADCSQCGRVTAVRHGMTPFGNQAFRCTVARAPFEVDKIFRGKVPGYERPIIGTCPICRRKAILVWDHDHTTGLKRGHICNRCNVMLGFGRDSSEVLRNGAYYLDKAKGRLD